ncbi:MAG TPA: POTRA domain-containing protein, partial [Parasegetibacter sp.]
MPRKLTLLVLFLTASLTSTLSLSAQEDTTKPVSVDPALEALFNSNTLKEVIVGNVTVSGNQRYDPALVISIAGISTGDRVLIPGSDIFSKAITNIWKQNLFANVQVYVTKLVGDTIDVEIAVTERPALASFNFRGVRKSEIEELNGKTGLIRGRPITENMKHTAIENIRKYYRGKGFLTTDVTILETPAPGLTNANDLTLVVSKGTKVRVNQVSIFGNDRVAESKIKKRLKGTKEMTRITLFPKEENSPFGVNEKPSFKEYLKEKGFLSLSKTKDFIDPYFRFKLFSSAKFDEEKYLEDKENLLKLYNSLGYRDATIVKDTQYYSANGNLNIDILVEEGRQYYFGNITWKGNTKFTDEQLSLVLDIEKGDIYNLETLNKRLGKEMSPEGGDITGYYMDDGYLFFRVDAIETAVYNDTIDFEIRIMEGPQATIKNVNITGNDKTKEYVIRRELRTVPGEKFNRTNLIRSNREIANLGFFNQENIQIEPVPNQDDGTVDINFGVEEKSSDQLELSAGWGGGIGLTGTLGVSFNNFSIKNIFNKEAWDPLPTGDGQKLSLRVQSNGRA